MARWQLFGYFGNIAASWFVTLYVYSIREEGLHSVQLNTHYLTLFLILLWNARLKEQIIKSYRLEGTSVGHLVWPVDQVVAQGPDQSNCEYFQRCIFHNLHAHLHHFLSNFMVKINIFLITNQNFFCSNMYPLPLVLLLYIFKKSLAFPSP